MDNTYENFLKALELYKQNKKALEISKFLNINYKTVNTWTVSFRYIIKNNIKLNDVTLCKYGCGNVAKFYLKNGEPCCENNVNSCPSNKLKNSKGLKIAYLEGRKKKEPHFESKCGWKKGQNALTCKKIKSQYSSADKIFCENSTISQCQLKKYVMQDESFIHKCQICNNTEWMGKPITLELDHINGCNNDNRRENLRCICPNCHSQTDTWKKRNSKNKQNKMVPDEVLLKALIEQKTIRKALKFVGLTNKGRNYTRCYELLLKNGYDKEYFNKNIKNEIKTINFDKDLIELLKYEMSLEDMAAKMNTYYNTLKSWCVKNNIHLPTLEERQEFYKNKSKLDNEKNSL